MSFLLNTLWSLKTLSSLSQNQSATLSCWVLSTKKVATSFELAFLAFYFVQRFITERIKDCKTKGSSIFMNVALHKSGYSWIVLEHIIISLRLSTNCIEICNHNYEVVSLLLWTAKSVVRNYESYEMLCKSS